MSETEQYSGWPALEILFGDDTAMVASQAEFSPNSGERLRLSAITNPRPDKLMFEDAVHAGTRYREGRERDRHDTKPAHVAGLAIRLMEKLAPTC